MKRFVISLVLVVMAVFSLSADAILKERYVNNVYEGRATVSLCSITETDGVHYTVVWEERDGSDVINIYDCTSLEQAFNVWNMSRYEIQSISQLFGEEVHTFPGESTLYLLKYYDIK